MLVCPGQGLPHALIGTYETYKRSTKIVLKWLKENGSDLQISDDAQLVTLSKILILAEAVRQRRIPLPNDIAFSFREAITYRHQITDWFNDKGDGRSGLDASTMRHEKFTETLQLVYDTLSTVEAPKSTSKNKAAPTKTKAIVMDENSPFNASLNRYTSLECEEPDEAPLATNHDHVVTKTKKIVKVEKDKQDRSRNDGMSIANDFLAVTMEAFIALMALDVILGIIKKAWDRASRNEIPFLVAGLISKVAWDWSAKHRSFLSGTRFLRTTDSFVKLQYRLQRLGVKEKLLKKGERLSSNSNACTDGNGLLLPMDVMDMQHVFGCIRYEKHLSFIEAYKHFRCTPNFRDDIMLGTLLADQASFPDEDHDDYNFNEHIFNTKGWLDCEERGCTCKRVAVAYNLRVQLEAMRAYFGAHKKNAGSTPKLKLRTPRAMLRLFANEVVENTRAVADNAGTQSCCEGSLAWECRALEDCVLKDFGKQSSAAYFQSPITVTNSILVVLQGLYGLGMRIINHRHYFATILHVYNALLVLGDIEPIEVLDELCSIFEDIVFLGEKPKRNFSSVFTRHRGGKVQFSEQSGYGRDLGSNRAWAMQVDDHVTIDDQHMEANHSRFSAGPDCTFFTDRFKNDDVPTRDYFWGRVYGLEKWMKPTETDRSVITHWLNDSKSPEEPFQQLADVITAEFKGTPIPRIKTNCCTSLQSSFKSRKWKGCSNNKSPKFSPMPQPHCSGCPGDTGCPCVNIHNSSATTNSLNVRLTPPVLSTRGGTNPISDRTVATIERKRGTGRLPVLQLKYGAIYLACADAVASANAWPWHDENYSKEKHKLDHTNRAMCFCSVDCFLMWGDHYVNQTKKCMDSKEKKMRKNWRRAVEMFRGRRCEEFLWASLSEGCAH